MCCQTFKEAMDQYNLSQLLKYCSNSILLELQSSNFRDCQRFCSEVLHWNEEEDQSILCQRPRLDAPWRKTGYWCNFKVFQFPPMPKLIWEKGHFMLILSYLILSHLPNINDLLYNKSFNQLFYIKTSNVQISELPNLE